MEGARPSGALSAGTVKANGKPSNSKPRVRVIFETTPASTPSVHKHCRWQAENLDANLGKLSRTSKLTSLEISGCKVAN